MISALNPALIATLYLGQTSFKETWEQQKKLQHDLIKGTGTETLLICEHSPVITLGTSSKDENILVDESGLKNQGVELFKIERGGDVTYHGPGQLVVYPIINLNNHKRDVAWYLRNLEQVIIDTLSHFDLKSGTIEGKTGVWTNPPEKDNNNGPRDNHPTVTQIPLRKIASIGVRISRWCTMHGLSINVRNCTSGFNLINPCGFKDIVITSLEQEGITTTVEDVGLIFEEKFKTIFCYS